MTLAGDARGARRRGALGRPVGIAMAGTLLWFGALRASAPPEPIAVVSEGALELEGERRVEVDAVEGDVYIVGSSADLVQFRSHRKGEPDVPLDVEVWSDGSTLGFRSPAEAEGTPRLLWVGVPARVAVGVTTDGSRIVLSGLDQDVDIEGARNDIRAENILGSTRVRGTATVLRMDGVDGDLTVNLVGGSVDLHELDGSIAGVLEGVGLKAVKGDDDWDLELAGGEVELRELAGGGVLRVENAVLELSDSSGSYRIESDSEVRLSRNDAMVEVEVDGGFVRGTDNEGVLTVHGWESRINLDNLRAPLTVDGEFLEVTLSAVSAAVDVRVRDGTVSLEGATEPVRLYCERGEVRVSGSEALLEIDSEDASVTVSRARGPVRVEGNGEHVEVGWQQWPKDADSEIVNRRGDVGITVPRYAGFRLAATSRYGRIDADLEGVHVSDDARRAHGAVRRRNRPVLTLEAEGDIRVREGSGS